MRDHNKLIESGVKAQIEKLELPRNQGKEDFDKPTLLELANLMDDEVDELWEELVGCGDCRSLKDIRLEAADVANFAHMIIYKCDKLMEEEG